ncbi:MAG: sodium:calcium exchanger, partial [Paraglaciecola sp.]|nr:sodium:calcium exchanger [Paraglaciecola sp.]
IVSVSYTTSSGTATIGTDVNATSGTLEWPDGDSANQYIDISIINDNETEEPESFVLTLTADEPNVLGLQSSVNVVIRDDESNQAPTATAGSDAQVNTRQNVTLTGSGTDPEAQPLNYLWQQISGTNVTINNANSPQASFTAPSAAVTLEFSLTTTDDFDLAGSDNVVITVIATTTTSNDSGGGSAYGLVLMSLLWLGMRRNCRKKQHSNTLAKQVR